MEYFRLLLSEKNNYFPYRIKINSIKIENMFEVYNKGYYHVEIYDYNNKENDNKMDEIELSPQHYEILKDKKSIELKIGNVYDKEKFGDVIIKIYYKEFLTPKKLGKIGFNTAFIEPGTKREKKLCFMADEIDPESLLTNKRIPENYKIIINYEIFCESCRGIGDTFCLDCTNFFTKNPKLLENWKQIMKYKNEYLKLKKPYNKDFLFGSIDSDDCDYVLENFKKNKEENKKKEENEEKIYVEENNDSNNSEDNSEGGDDYITNKEKNKLNDSFESECIIL